DASIEALGRIGSPAAVPVLVQALKDPRTGSLAVRALGNMGPTARGAIPALREFQSQNGSSHSDEVEAAIKAISEWRSGREGIVVAETFAPSLSGVIW